MNFYLTAPFVNCKLVGTYERMRHPLVVWKVYDTQRRYLVHFDGWADNNEVTAVMVVQELGVARSVAAW